jgi:hypothetical protein
VSLDVFQASRTQTWHEPETGAPLCETAERVSPEPDTEIKGTIELRLLGSCLRATNDTQSVARVLDIFQLLHAPDDDACSLERVTSTCRHTADTMDITAEVVQYIFQKTLCAKETRS